jgi:hypothetical protein
MSVPRYDRESEFSYVPPALDAGELIPLHELERELLSSNLSEGGRDLVRGLHQLGRPAVFPGGGVGIEYAGLLKTAANPRYLRRHVQEVAQHLRDQRVDIVVIPGLSGYLVGSMYSIVAELPAVLFKKDRIVGGQSADQPIGSFIIASYTSDGDFLMSADPAAVRDIVNQVLSGQLEAQSDAEAIRLSLRFAGADDIIDKATMARAVSQSCLLIGNEAIEVFADEYRERTGDKREIRTQVAVVAWVAPLIKDYNRPRERLQQLLGVNPFAGLDITSVQLDPPAIGISGLGAVSFR